MVILRNGIVYSLRMVMPNDDISGSVNERLNNIGQKDRLE